MSRGLVILVGLGVLGASSCFTFVNFDLEDGAGGMSSTANTSAGGGGPGAGGQGGASLVCDNGWECGPDSLCVERERGICTPVGSAQLGFDTSGIDLAVRGPDPAQTEQPGRGPDLVSLSQGDLRRWRPDFAASGSPEALFATGTDGGSLLGAPSRVFRLPQSRTAAAACLDVFDTQPNLACRGTATWTATNGVATGGVFAGDDFYFLAPGGGVPQIWRVQEGTKCLSNDQGSCATSPTCPVSHSRDIWSGNGPTTAALSRLEYAKNNDLLWWNTIGTGGCVYALAPDFLGGNIDCTIEPAERPHSLTASDAGVFVATTTDNITPDGPVFAVSEGTPSTWTAITALESRARWPLDSDERFLYARVEGKTPAMIVAVSIAGPANANGKVIGTASADSGEAQIRAINSADAHYVYFATETKLYRWRKPGCMGGDGSCGDGCIDLGEECDSSMGCTENCKLQ